MKQDSKISVVIPFYNGSKYIDRALKSIENQTYKVHETFIVDDGSTRAESTYLKFVESQYKVKVLRKNNAGQSSARNYGVEMCTGEYIAFLDQDDEFLPNHVEVLLKVLTSENAGSKTAIAIGRSKKIGLDLSSRTNRIKSNLAKNLDRRSFYSLIKGNLNLLPSAMIIDRQAFLKLGGFNVELIGYEDDELMIRASLSGISIRITTDVTTNWHQGLESSSRSPQMRESKLKFIQSAFEIQRINELKNIDRARRILFRRFALSYLGDSLRTVGGEAEAFDRQNTISKVFLAETKPIKKLPTRNLALLGIFVSWIAAGRLLSRIPKMLKTPF